jgi:hypothetical protein
MSTHKNLWGKEFFMGCVKMKKKTRETGCEAWPVKPDVINPKNDPKETISTVLVLQCGKKHHISPLPSFISSNLYSSHPAKSPPYPSAFNTDVPVWRMVASNFPRGVAWRRFFVNEVHRHLYRASGSHLRAYAAPEHHIPLQSGISGGGIIQRAHDDDAGSSRVARPAASSPLLRLRTVRGRRSEHT